MDKKLALKVNDKDNVATLFADNVRDGDEIDVRDQRGSSVKIKVMGDIPYGHKASLRDIQQGEAIIKYGEELGVASHNIKTGEYVHVHNLDSMRGRGDL